MLEIAFSVPMFWVEFGVGFVAGIVFPIIIARMASGKKKDAG